MDKIEWLNEQMVRWVDEFLESEEWVMVRT